jgi:hypothetical protein
MRYRGWISAGENDIEERILMIEDDECGQSKTVRRNGDLLTNE